MAMNLCVRKILINGSDCCGDKAAAQQLKPAHNGYSLT